MTWYLTDGGTRWQRVVEIISNLLGVATVRLYNGEIVRGRMRRSGEDRLVDAI